MITNDVIDYIGLFVRIAHIICNHPIYQNLSPLVDLCIEYYSSI